VCDNEPDGIEIKISNFFWKCFVGVQQIEYEIIVSAYFALKLNNKDVQQFSIQSNVKHFGNMDDVVVDISTQNNKQKENKYKKLSPGSFEAQTGNFSLKIYCQAFKNLTDQNKQSPFILYTNADFNSHRKEEMTNFKMIEDYQSEVNLLLNTSFDERNVDKFEVNEKMPDEEEVTKSDYEEFLSRFVCQKNFQDLKQDLIEFCITRT
jgi:hypothetical protein